MELIEAEGLSKEYWLNQLKLATIKIFLKYYEIEQNRRAVYILNEI